MGALRDFRNKLIGKGVDLNTAIAAGAGANTNITVTGIKMTDKILCVLELQPPTAGSGSAIQAVRTSITSITAADTIQLTSSTTGNQLLIQWLTS